MPHSDLLNQNLWGRRPEIGVLTSSPCDSHAHQSLKTTTLVDIFFVVPQTKSRGDTFSFSHPRNSWHKLISPIQSKQNAEALASMFEKQHSTEQQFSKYGLRPVAWAPTGSSGVWFSKLWSKELFR